VKKHFVPAFIAVLLLAALSGCAAAGDSQIIRVAFNQSETHAEYLAMRDFGEKFYEATGGRYEVQIYCWATKAPSPR